MVTSEKQFNKRAKKLIRMICNNENIENLPYEDNHIIAECINKGYLKSKYLVTTADGKYHFELLEISPVTLDGIKFAYPQRNWINIVTMIAAIITAIATSAQALIQILK